LALTPAAKRCDVSSLSIGLTNFDDGVFVRFVVGHDTIRIPQPPKVPTNRANSLGAKSRSSGTARRITAGSNTTLRSIWPRGAHWLLASKNST
jgi:hypothetical protein